MLIAEHMQPKRTFNIMVEHMTHIRQSSLFTTSRLLLQSGTADTHDGSF